MNELPMGPVFDLQELQEIASTAMCLWEARLESSNFELWDKLNKIQPEIGACEMRQRFIDIAEFIEGFCKRNPAIHDLLVSIGCWDWEVCPALLAQFVEDWPDDFPSLNKEQLIKSIIRVAGAKR